MRRADPMRQEELRRASIANRWASRNRHAHVVFAAAMSWDARRI